MSAEDRPELSAQCPISSSSPLPGCYPSTKEIIDSAESYLYIGFFAFAGLQALTLIFCTLALCLSRHDKDENRRLREVNID
jgi:hypothetical protein